MLWFGSRWYDPYLNQWNQPDSIIPDQYTPADWNRYSYVRYNPLKFVDPDGHRPVCEGMGSCTDQWRQEKAYQRLGEVGFWKHEIKREFGITMSDSGDKSWDARNLGLMYTSLQNVDNALNGKLASFSKGTMFKLMNYTGDYEYRGLTHTDGTGIDFYTKGSAAIRQMNIYHEIGHLLDNAPGSKDVFMNAVTNAGDPSWVTDSGYVDTQNALRNSRVNDPNYRTAQAIQASTNHVAEQWADAFANYVAGNININTAAGADMNNFVTGVLAPYIGVP